MYIIKITVETTMNFFKFSVQLRETYHKSSASVDQCHTLSSVASPAVTDMLRDLTL